MDKRNINSGKFKFIENELTIFQNDGIITKEQKEIMLSNYTVGSEINFVRILLAIGSVLIGLGILTFIASNWQGFTKSIKFIIIIFLFITSNIISYSVYDSYPKTSKSFLYLSTLIYGAGIFLVAQMFNFSSYFSTSILLWFLGVIPYGILFKDHILFSFSQVLIFIYISSYFSSGKEPYLLFLIIPLMYISNSKIFNNSNILTFLNNILLIDGLIYFASRSDLISRYITMCLFIIGLVFYYGPIKLNKEVFRFQGNIIFGVTGIILTYKNVWEELKIFSPNTASSICLVFSLLFFIFLLYLINKGSLLSLAFLCFTILRYYFDVAYDFLPKSIFFILGGIILMSMGYYFEKLRKRGI